MMFGGIYREQKSRYGIALSALVLAFGVACGSASSDSTSSQRQTEADFGSLTTILATKDLRVGTQRVSFLLTSPTALVKSPTALVTTRRLDGDGEVSETKQAKFHLWPYGIRGAYSTELTFDRPGKWLLEAEVQDGGMTERGRLELEIAKKSPIPDLGMVPPLSSTKTLSAIGDFQLLTTDYTPDRDLYQVSLADVASTKQPTVIVFATPAFCTSPTCGPQVDTVSELKDAHQGEANFIHVEIYDNPDEIQGNLSRARFTQAVKDWKLDQLPNWFNESWTFVLDSEGRIHQRFEGFVTLEELEESLQQILVEG